MKNIVNFTRNAVKSVSLSWYKLIYECEYNCGNKQQSLVKTTRQTTKFVKRLRVSYYKSSNTVYTCKK